MKSRNHLQKKEKTKKTKLLGSKTFLLFLQVTLSLCNYLVWCSQFIDPMDHYCFLLLLRGWCDTLCEARSLVTGGLCNLGQHTGEMKTGLHSGSPPSGGCCHLRDIGIAPHERNPPRTGPVLLTLLFSPLVPLSCSVLHGSFYSFPLVRYSCLLSTSVLHALLCLKVYSWCIREDRCTPRPPAPSPSCSFLSLL